MTRLSHGRWLGPLLALLVFAWAIAAALMGTCR